MWRRRGELGCYFIVSFVCTFQCRFCFNKTCYYGNVLISYLTLNDGEERFRSLIILNMLTHYCLRLRVNKHKVILITIDN